MRPRPIPGFRALIIIAVLALLLAALCDGVHAQEPLIDVLVPCAVAYECVENLVVANATLSWHFSFNPRRAAIYDIVHWTTQLAGERSREYVAQLASRQNGEHVIRYYRIYEYVAKRDWKRLWLGHRREWQELELGSKGHENANAGMSRLFGFSMALRGGSEPVSLTF